jgi:hypothetical protein
MQGEFAVLYALFVLAMVAQVIVGRTHLLAVRGHVPDTSGVISSLIGIAAGLSFFVIILWGFATFHWYFVLPTIVFMGFISGMIVTRTSWLFWYQAKAVVDFIAIALTIFLWWRYWPF